MRYVSVFITGACFAMLAAAHSEGLAVVAGILTGALLALAMPMKRAGG